MNPPDRITCPQCTGPLELAGPLAGLCPRCLLAGDHKPTVVDGQPVTLPGSDELSPDLPQFDILELIGRGGMGLVYRAKHRRLDRDIALKVLAPELSNCQDFADRFLREARMLARLEHPNIVGVHDFGESGGVFYLVLELVDGASLRDLLESETHLQPEQALAIVPQICAGLNYAHSMGIVHRDIKPENILIDKQGHVKIADFGLAKLIGSDSERSALTRRSQVMGTPQYMAPEQLKATRDVDHRADIFSLGVVFYEMLTGDLPVGRFEPPSKRYHIDVRLDEVVLRALEREPAKRYQSAGDVNTDLNALRANVGAVPGNSSRTGSQPDEGATNVDYPAFITRTPLDPWSMICISVGLGLLWLIGFASQDLGRNQEWLAGAYPLAFLGAAAFRTPVAKSTLATWLRRAAVGASMVICCVTIVLMSIGYGDAGQVFPETAAAILVVGAHLAFERWGRRGDYGALLVCGILLLIAGVMHASLLPYRRPGEFLAYTSGMLSVLTLGSILPLAAEYALPPAPSVTSRQMRRVLLVGLPGVCVYFAPILF